MVSISTKHTQVIPSLTDGKTPAGCMDRCHLGAVLPRTGPLAVGTAAAVAAVVVDCIAHMKRDTLRLDRSRPKMDCEPECLAAGSLCQVRL